MKSACGPKFMRFLAHDLPKTAVLFRDHALCACMIRIAAHAPAQDFVAHGGEMQREEQQREGHRHDQQRPQNRRIDGRAAHAQDRRRLMQRVPPIDRELDDRNVDRADQRQHRRRARAAARIFGGPIEREHAEIEQEQHQHGGEPRVPHPIGAPGRPAPQRAGDQADECEGGADRRGRLGRRRRPADAAIPACRARRRSSAPQPIMPSQAAGTCRNMILTVAPC